MNKKVKISIHSDIKKVKIGAEKVSQGSLHQDFNFVSMQLQTGGAIEWLEEEM